MRGERATLGKSLLDVQRELKIKANYIAAIENADPSVFETPGFIAGYVRSYARFLGLDPDWAFDRFCEESGFSGVEGLSATTAATSKGKASPSMGLKLREDPIMQPKAPFVPAGESVFARIEPGAVGSVVVMLALISALGFGGWTVLNEIQRVNFAPVEQTAGVATEVIGLQTGTTGEVAPVTNTRFTAPTPDALDRLYRPQVLEAPVLTARDGPIASLDPNTTGALVDAVAAFQAELEVARTEVDAPVLPAPPQVLEEDKPDVVLFAVRPAWVRVASTDGTILFEKILDAGEQYVLPQSDEPPLLRAGNSGSVFFNVKGETYGPAGRDGSVVKNVALGINALKENYAKADTTEAVLAETLKAMADTEVEADPDATITQ
ncbi:MAG: helix-turn-helix domain-containing protein [Litoreibacter sp.]|nr:helix-turn-helix domain-containing protein [Litoreibacter sp.]